MPPKVPKMGLHRASSGSKRFLAAPPLRPPCQPALPHRPSLRPLPPRQRHRGSSPSLFRGQSRLSALPPAPGGGRGLHFPARSARDGGRPCSPPASTAGFPPIPAASLGVAGSEPPPPAAGSSAVRGCPVPGPCRYLGEPGLFLTWMCSVICFPHSTETGTAEGPGARRAGARDTSSWCAAKDGGGVLRPERWPRALGIRPAARPTLPSRPTSAGTGKAGSFEKNHSSIVLQSHTE
ncbi:uncharacterized protein LOC132087593 [Ammospiza nelsoni]|uniref:uncharacterized protein LOC132087593 n=1 Tax=Ammospiza nelsoni TaxID=2857394 RepID=UPI002869B7D1|nr:uncharacterized protein LOC132087593 [Ammospiza nelsoni]